MKAKQFPWKKEKLVSVIKNYNYKRNKYSAKFAFYSLISKKFNQKKGGSPFNLFIERKKADSISEYLSKFFKEVLERYKNECIPTSNNKKGPIWVFWWQGENAAPPIVKRCIASIRQNSSGHQVILMDKNNFFDYVDVPESVLKKVYSGEVTKNQFANFLRLSLLANHGGAWIDATVYLSRPISEEVFSYAFYSMKASTPNTGRLYFAKWSTFFIAGTKGNPLFTFLRDCYLLHWELNQEQIHYFLFDHLIWIAYRHIDTFKLMIDEVPYNNTGKLRLQRELDKPYDEKNFQEIIKETHMHKLTWKKEYRLIAEINQPTFYGCLISENFYTHH
jgi:hypothetical protein